MAGGRGTRIASVANDVPKPMINICGKPILEHQIDNLKASIGNCGCFIQDDSAYRRFSAPLWRCDN